MSKELHCYKGDGLKTEHGTLTGPNGETLTHVSYDVGEVWVDHELSREELAKIKTRRSSMLAHSFAPKK